MLIGMNQSAVLLGTLFNYQLPSTKKAVRRHVFDPQDIVH